MHLKMSSEKENIKEIQVLYKYSTSTVRLPLTGSTGTSTGTGTGTGCLLYTSDAADE